MNKNPDWENEREWRRFLLDEVRNLRGDIGEIKEEVGKVNSVLTGLKVKVAVVASIISGAVAITIKKLGI